MTKPPPPPRLYAIVAAQAPIALVFRRGPSKTFHLLKWHLDNGELEHGVWTSKTLYPERCDLSADGRLMTYYIGSGYAGKYRVFIGVSRAGCLTTLFEQEEDSTWGRGLCFINNATRHTFGESFGLEVDGRQVVVGRNDNTSSINERRRGWTDDFDSTSDSRALRKSHALHEHTLRCNQDCWGQTPRYELVGAAKQLPDLTDAVWADWDHSGKLLIATKHGQLIMVDPHRQWSTVVTHDLVSMTPDPKPSLG